MAFIGNKTRNKMEIKNDLNVDVLNIPINNMVLKDASHTAHFKRLGYRLCPSIISNSKTTEFKNADELIDMERWEQVRSIYTAMVQIKRSDRSKINMFNAIISLTRNCDENNILNIISFESVVSFISFLKKRYHLGIKGTSLKNIQGVVKGLIFEMDPLLCEKLNKHFLKFPNDSQSTLPYTDQEVKLLIKSLYKIFNGYRKVLLDGEKPKKHPLYKEGCKGLSIRSWENQLIKSAYFLTSFYTGANESSLLNLRYSDISTIQFDQTARGSFKLRTVKNRQKGKVNFIDVGFTKRAKEFFETWLILCKILTNNKSDFIFPKIAKGKIEQSTPSQMPNTINNVFKNLGLPLLRTKRFRKTKATLIMRATESIFTVAEGLNNTADTVSKHYSDGDPVKMNFTLAGALDVRHRTLHGQSLDKAVKDSAYVFSDPVRESFLIKNNLKKPSVLSNGLRCEEPFGSKSEKLKSSLIKAGIANENSKVACYKFLECFSCEHHAVIAEVEDIWLLLSFRDVILDSSTKPSINAMPTETLTKIINTIESILQRLKTNFNHNYKLAMKKYNVASHPLWEEKYELNNIMEIF